MVLMEELVEEVILRFWPAEPTRLVRAALVCKLWCRLISGRRFHRRFREFHRSPPMLIYLYTLIPNKDSGGVSRFFPASSACPRYADQVCWKALDARHGRVLLYRLPRRRNCYPSPRGPRLSVWDLITGERWDLPRLLGGWEWDKDEDSDWNAAVLCAASGSGAYDHLDCRGKPFLVVFVGSTGTEEIFLWFYSLETGSWSEPTFAAPKPEYGVTRNVPPALVGNTLYFMAEMVDSSILRYDLVTREASMIENEAAKSMNDASRSMAIEDGGMAVGVENYSRLFLWSMEASPKGDISWKKIRVIELNELFPVKVRRVDADSFAFVPGFGILVTTNFQRLFIIDLKSDKVEVVCEGPVMGSIVPYMSFYIPALGSFARVEGPGADADADASSP